MGYKNPSLLRRMRSASVAWVLLLAGGIACATGAHAADESTSAGTANSTAANPTAAVSDQDEQLRAELKHAEEEIRELEQRLAADEAARAPAAQTPFPTSSSAGPPTPVVPAPTASTLFGEFDRSGFTLQSADGADAIHLRGTVAVDDRQFVDGYTPETADTWLLRKLRPTLEGTLDHYFDFRIMPDFGQGKAILQDGWADARVEPWLVFTAGKFKAPVGLERLQLEQFSRFIEAALPSDLLPYRDLGFKVGGVVDRGVFSYDVGIFDGTIDAGSTDGNPVPDEDATGKYTGEGRVFVNPFLPTDLSALRGLGFGIAETYVKDKGVATTSTTTSYLASYKTTGQQAMFSYRADTAIGFNNATIAHGIERRLVPQLFWAYGPVYLLSEYVRENQQLMRQVSVASTRDATLLNTAWQVQGGWFITGEREAYDDATPRRNLGQGGAGAWELVARIHAIRFDEAAFIGGANSFANPASDPLSAHALGVGLNWYLNFNFKVQLDYEVTEFDGGAVSGNRPDERVLTTQFALIF